MVLTLFAILAFAQSGIPPQPAHTSKVDLRPTIHMFEKASGLPHLTPESAFTLRVWWVPVMVPEISGIAIKKTQLRTISATSAYTHGKYMVNHARIGSATNVSNLGRIKAIVSSLVPYSGTATSCGVADGVTILIHAVIQGHVIKIQAGNPTWCDGNLSKTVVRLLHEIQSQVPAEASSNTALKPTPNRSTVRRSLALR